MKRVSKFMSAVTLLMVFALFYGCKKTDLPTLTTTAVSSITTTTASSGGNITDDGGAEVTARGVCWGTTTKPEITAVTKTSDLKGTGSFTSSITGLTPGTTYYVRAYATNSEGTAYGNELSFQALPLAGATVATVKPATITATTANPGGNVTLDGGSAVTERGICWGTAANPTKATNKLAASAAGTGTFTVNLINLLPGTLYHIRAYADNSTGTTYGADETFTTLKVKATVTTAAVSNPTQTTATAGGEVTATGGADVTERGVYYGTQSNPGTTGTKAAAAAGGLGVFTVNLANLTAGTKYYVVAYAISSEGTSLGTTVEFDTSPIVKATLTTASPAFIPASATSVTSGGTITSNGGGTITERGVCWSTSPLPEVEDAADFHVVDAGATSPFTVTLASLSEGTLYYVRAYAYNDAGFSYGNEVTVLTMMSDTENNIYKTVKIGNQVWMAENLKATQYKGGNTPIPNVTGNGSWFALTDPAYCWYDDNDDNKAIYGALYNWFAVNTGNICPTGWHVPTDAEFNTMELQLGINPANINDWGYRGLDEGSKMKNQTGWAAGQNGSNLSGFSALPGGYRSNTSGISSDMGNLTYFWTASEDPDVPATAWYRLLTGAENRVYRATTGEKAGKYVRCVKDND